jgi:hypothetical protein
MISVIFPFAFAILLVTTLHTTWPLKYRGTGK